MCTVLLPPDGYPIAVKYITYHIIIVCIPICLLPINPTPRPYLRVTWIRTLGHVVGGNRCGGDTLLRVITTRWLTGLSSGQAKMEGVVLKAAWHWGSDSSVVNDPLPSAWSSADGDRIFSSNSWKDFLTGEYERYKSINQPLALETEHLSPLGPLWGTWSGAPLPKEKVRFCFYREMFKRRLWRRVSLSIGASLGNMGRGFRLPGTWRDSWRALETERSSLWEPY